MIHEIALGKNWEEAFEWLTANHGDPYESRILDFTDSLPWVKAPPEVKARIRRNFQRSSTTWWAAQDRGPGWNWDSDGPMVVILFFIKDPRVATLFKLQFHDTQ